MKMGRGHTNYHFVEVHSLLCTSITHLRSMVKILLLVGRKVRSKAVGFGRRNYLVPIREAATFADLNTLVLELCRQDDTRRVSRQSMTIGEAWEQEKPYLLPLQATNAIRRTSSFRTGKVMNFSPHDL